MTTARTLMTIVKQYCEASEVAGLRPQQVRYSMKKLSDLTGLSREAVRDALKEPTLGFINTNNAWRVGKDFKFKDVETNFSALSGDRIKLMWWAALPTYNWEDYGANINVTRDEQIALGLVRKTLAEGKSLDDIGALLGKELGPQQKEREVKKEVVRIKEECKLEHGTNEPCTEEHMPEWLAQDDSFTSILKAINDGVVTSAKMEQLRQDLVDKVALNLQGAVYNGNYPKAGGLQDIYVIALWSSKLKANAKAKAKSKPETKSTTIQPIVVD